MSLAVINCRAFQGMDAPLVRVETHISKGLPRFNIVGLAETTVKESRDRVRSALINSHFEVPARRITVNLSPADMPKSGGRFDLAIALSILAAFDYFDAKQFSHYEFVGELRLSGELIPVKGILPFAIATRKAKNTLVLSYANAEEASLTDDIDILPAKQLLDVYAHLCRKKKISPYIGQEKVLQKQQSVDMVSIQGQAQARRCLEIAASGGHSLLMQGPPGTGKTLLASALIGLLPQLNIDQALETAAIASISSGGFDAKHWRQRPFRSPHHTASTVALVGGGSNPRPGEISLAHNGILFLDELPEFERRVLESLREPLESGKISISRAARQVEFLAKFQFIAAMNPCPCGHYNDPQKECRCSPNQIQRYWARISGPLLDRIDMHIDVQRLDNAEMLRSKHENESTEIVNQRVKLAQNLQIQRINKLNTELDPQEIKIHCKLNREDENFLLNAIQKLALSMRTYHRLLRVARTIADIEMQALIKRSHLKEALLYQKLNRE